MIEQTWMNGKADSVMLYGITFEVPDLNTPGELHVFRDDSEQQLLHWSTLDGFVWQVPLDSPFAVPAHGRLRFATDIAGSAVRLSYRDKRGMHTATIEFGGARDSHADWRDLN